MVAKVLLTYGFLTLVSWTHGRAACEMYPHSYWSVNHKMPSTAQICQKYKVSLFHTPESC